MVEVFYKGSKYRFYNSERKRGGTWICEEGSCLGQLSRMRGITVPIVFWSELQTAAIDAGYEKECFAPLVADKTQKKRASKKKSDRPTISIF